MPLQPIPDFAPFEIIPSSWANTLKSNMALLDGRTGGDPPVAGRFLVALAGGLGSWRLLQSGDFSAGLIPDTALAVAKLNKAGDEAQYDLAVTRRATGHPEEGVLYLAQAPNGVYIHNTNTAINIVGRPVTMSHGLTVGGTLIVNGDVFARRTGSAPTTGYILFGTDNHFIGWDGAQFVGDGARLYRSSDFLIGNAASQVPFSNGVVCVGLNADLLDGAHRGSGANQIPTNDGTLNSQLNAWYLHGLLPSNATGQVPISNGVLCTSLNADLVDGYHVGNAANQVPLSNAGLNVNLNAEFLGGQPRTYYEGLAASGVPAGVVAMWKTAVPPGGWVIDADYQNRFPVGAAAAHPLNTNGGVGTHQHDINHGHGAAKATGIANATGTGSTSSSPPPSFSEDTHTHNFLVDATGSLLTAALNHEPPWRGVHFIRKT